MASYSSDHIVKVSTNLSELIVHCKFKNNNCHEIGGFHLFFHHKFGVCYTFRTHNAKLFETSTGPDSGLSLILKGNHMINPVYDTVSNIANAASLKVTIHEAGTLPPILRNGIDIMPGTSTNTVRPP